MSFKKEVNGEKTFLKIDGSMSIYEATALREACMECLKDCEAMEIDLSGVSECDITGVQLLYSARMTAEATKKIFEVTAVSPAVIEAMVASGLNL